MKFKLIVEKRFLVEDLKRFFQFEGISERIQEEFELTM